MIVEGAIFRGVESFCVWVFDGEFVVSWWLVLCGENTFCFFDLFF
jgi:hypothetical protein